MTFQACSIDEGRHLYDQLAAVTPIVVSTGSTTNISDTWQSGIPSDVAYKHSFEIIFTTRDDPPSRVAGPTFFFFFFFWGGGGG